MAFLNRSVTPAGFGGGSLISMDFGSVVVDAASVQPMREGGPLIQEHAAGERYAESIITDLGDYACVRESRLDGAWQFLLEDPEVLLRTELIFDGVVDGSVFRATRCRNAITKPFREGEDEPRVPSRPLAYLVTKPVNSVRVISTIEATTPALSLTNDGVLGGYFEPPAGAVAPAQEGTRTVFVFTNALARFALGTAQDHAFLHAPGSRAVVAWRANTNAGSKTVFATCPNDPTEVGVVFRYNSTSTRWELRVYNGSGVPALSVDSGAGAVNVGDYSFWLTKDGDAYSVWFGGSLLLSGTASGLVDAAASSPLIIGGGVVAEAEPLAGRLSEFATYDRALTSAELTALVAGLRRATGCYTLPRPLPNTFVGMKLIASSNAVRTVTGSRLVYSGGQPLYLELDLDSGSGSMATGPWALSTDYVGTTYATRRPIIGLTYVAGNVTFASARGDTRLFPRPPWSAVSGLQAGNRQRYFVHAPADTVVWVKGQHEVIAETISVDGLAVRCRGINWTIGEHSGKYAIPDWNIQKVHRIVTNDEDTLFLEKPLGSEYAAGSTAVILTEKNSVRYTQLCRQLSRFTTDDGRVFVRFRDYQVPVPLEEWRMDAGVRLYTSAGPEVNNVVNLGRTAGFTLQNSAPLTALLWRGTPNRELYAVGTNRFLQATSRHLFSTTASGSFSWAGSVTNASGVSSLFDSYQSATPGRMRITAAVSSGVVTLTVSVYRNSSGGTTHDGTFVVPVAVGERFSLTGVYDAVAGEYRYYVNGGLVAIRRRTAEPADTALGSGLSVGTNWAGVHMHGTISRLAFWNSALSAAQVLEDHNDNVAALIA